MKALILAAGRGTRVQPLTYDMPKPMIPIVHKPVMELLVDQLKLHGVDEIIINTSYLSPQIENYFRGGHRFGVEIAYSFEGYEQDGKLFDQPLGSAGAIRKIQAHSGFFDSTFIVVCGDAIVDLDLTEMLRFHRERKSIATIALKTVAEEELKNYGVVVADDMGRITGFQEKPSAGEAKSRMANTGIYIFEPEILNWIPEDGVFDIGGQLFPALVESGAPMYGIELPFQWLDIGRLQDYHRAVMQAMRGEVPAFTPPGREIRPGVWVGPNVKANFDTLDMRGPIYIGGSARIGDGCTLIGPVVIGSGADIEAGSHLEKTIVMEYTRIAQPCFLEEKLVGKSFCIDTEGSVLDARHSDTSWLFNDARSHADRLNEDQAWLLGSKAA